MNRVDGKVAIVTGGGSGIGKACCTLLSQAGAAVVVSDIDLLSAQETAKGVNELGGKSLAVQHDVTSEEGWKRLIDLTLDNFERLDVLVNNAGVCIVEECREISLEHWRQVNGVNLEGAFLGVRSAIDTMVKKGNSGSIINISSIAGLVGDNPVSYSAAKGGLKMLSKAAAVECGKLGYDIRVNTIFPGPIETAMNSLFSESTVTNLMKLLPVGRYGQAIDIARGVLFLASDDSSFMTGSDMVIDGGITAGAGGALIGI